jgi:peroxiredoxin
MAISHDQMVYNKRFARNKDTTFYIHPDDGKYVASYKEQVKHLESGGKGVSHDMP